MTITVTVYYAPTLGAPDSKQYTFTDAKQAAMFADMLRRDGQRHALHYN